LLLPKHHKEDEHIVVLKEGPITLYKENTTTTVVEPVPRIVLQIEE